jgi:hypothetical protein
VKKLVYFQILITLVFSAAISALLENRYGASFLLGGLLVAINLVLHVFVWTYLIVKKKLIAFAISIIVFKYAIFGAIIYNILKTSWVDPLYFSAGIGTLVISSLCVAFLRNEYVV